MISRHGICSPFLFCIALGCICQLCLQSKTFYVLDTCLVIMQHSTSSFQIFLALNVPDKNVGVVAEPSPVKSNFGARPWSLTRSACPEQLENLSVALLVKAAISSSGMLLCFSDSHFLHLISANHSSRLKFKLASINPLTDNHSFGLTIMHFKPVAFELAFCPFLLAHSLSFVCSQFSFQQVANRLCNFLTFCFLFFFFFSSTWSVDNDEQCNNPRQAQPCPSQAFNRE